MIYLEEEKEEAEEKEEEECHGLQRP